MREELTEQTNMLRTERGWKCEAMCFRPGLAEKDGGVIFSVIVRLYNEVRRMARGNITEKSPIRVYLPFSFLDAAHRTDVTGRSLNDYLASWDAMGSNGTYAFAETYGKDALCVTGEVVIG